MWHLFKTSGDLGCCLWFRLMVGNQELLKSQRKAIFLDAEEEPKEPCPGIRFFKVEADHEFIGP